MLAENQRRDGTDRFRRIISSERILDVPSWWIRLHGEGMGADTALWSDHRSGDLLSIGWICKVPSIEFRGQPKAVFTEARRRRFSSSAAVSARSPMPLTVHSSGDTCGTAPESHASQSLVQWASA